MGEGSEAVDLIVFASVFDISFDSTSLELYLHQRKKIGGLDDQELFAESLLFWKSKEPRDFFAYLEKYQARLRKVFNPAFLATMQVDALLKDGQTERARALITLYENDLGDLECRRLNLLIDIQEGNDLGGSLRLSISKRTVSRICDL